MIYEHNNNTIHIWFGAVRSWVLVKNQQWSQFSGPQLTKKNPPTPELAKTKRLFPARRLERMTWNLLSLQAIQRLRKGKGHWKTTCPRHLHLVPLPPGYIGGVLDWRTKEFKNLSSDNIILLVIPNISTLKNTCNQQNQATLVGTQEPKNPKHHPPLKGGVSKM